MKTLPTAIRAAAIIILPVALAFFMIEISFPALASYAGWFGSALCESSMEYNCVTLGKRVVEKKTGARTVRKLADPTWESEYPDEVEREIVMKVNRMNTPLRAGLTIAVPSEMSGKTIMDFSPFAGRIDPPGEKLLIFDPRLYAFAAYDPEGKLVRWGPAVGGRPGYWTPVGTFEVYSKGGPDCRSRQYPPGCEGKGCTPMPWCMTFRYGNAFHAGELPGRHQSHGCVRLFLDDARWLNREFVEIGTRVVVKPY